MHHSVPSTQYHHHIALALTSTTQHPSPLSTVQYSPGCSVPTPTALSTLSVHLSVCVGMCERCCGHCLLHLHQQSLLYYSHSFILVYWCDAHASHCMRRTWCCCYCTWLKMRRFVSLSLEIFHFWAGQVGRARGYSGQTCRCLDPATLTSWGSLN